MVIEKAKTIGRLDAAAAYFASLDQTDPRKDEAWLALRRVVAEYAQRTT